MLPIDYQLRMQELLSDEYDGYVKCFKAPEYRALRLNPLKTDRAQFPAFIGELEKQLKQDGSDVLFEQVPWEECGYYYFGSEDIKLGNQVFHEAGAYYIQEPSAMMPVAMLDVRPGDKVLDLCAAPGGKSTQAAGYMEGKGLLVCNEIVPSRAAVLSRNIERLGVRNAMVLNETPQRLKDVFVDYFDKILVDAPCSGEGMFRKNPEAVNEWSVDNVNKCAARQDEILDCAASMLRCGGTLVYSTCTFSREEDEDCIERFIVRHPDYEVVKTDKLFPHKVRGEGHFCAKLLRKGGSERGYCTLNTTGRKKSGKKGGAGMRDRLSAFEAFLTETIRETGIEQTADGMSCLTGNLEGRLIFFGDNLYMLPKDAPEPDGLKTQRPGLQLGSFTGNKRPGSQDRFIPSHALALSLKPFQVTDPVDITMEEARKFMEGLTVSAPSTDVGNKSGWCLVCTGGIGTGWGRLAGGIIKNHYPKGLRIHLK